MAVGNKVIFIGNAVQDVAIQKSATGANIARFTLARNRFKGSSNDNAVDYVDFTAFGKNAEFATKYIKKGTKIGVEGYIATSVYEKDGKKMKSVSVVVDAFEFVSGSTTSTKNSNTKEMDVNTSTSTTKNTSDSDDLPF